LRADSSQERAWPASLQDSAAALPAHRSPAGFQTSTSFSVFAFFSWFQAVTCSGRA